MSFRLCLLHIAFRASILCVVLVIAGTTTFSQTDRTKLSEQEDAYISAEAAHHFFRGGVLVGINGRIVFEKAYGMGDEEWATPNTLNTKFRIASLSKQFTSACILLLQERGRLNVHDPNPAFRQRGKPYRSINCLPTLREYPTTRVALTSRNSTAQEHPRSK